MPSNRSNSERCKAFDIDTKIEYMNKLYEVRESNSCCDCSLATICSSSDISAGDRNDDEDDKYNEMTIRLGIKNAIQRHLRFANLHDNSNVKIERDFKV